MNRKWWRRRHKSAYRMGIAPRNVRRNGTLDALCDSIMYCLNDVFKHVEIHWPEGFDVNG